MTPKAEDVLRKIRDLRLYQQQSGFRTTRSQNELLQTLNADELAYTVAELLHHSS